MKQRATIDNWAEYECYPSGTVLVGTVTNHSRQGSFHTAQQQTSRIVSLNRKTRIAETENTIYTLGKELK